MSLSRAGWVWLHQVCSLVQRSHQLQPPRPHNQQVGENTERILALIIKLNCSSLNFVLYWLMFPLFKSGLVKVLRCWWDWGQPSGQTGEGELNSLDACKLQGLLTLRGARMFPRLTHMHLQKYKRPSCFWEWDQQHARDGGSIKLFSLSLSPSSKS